MTTVEQLLVTLHMLCWLNLNMVSRTTVLFFVASGGWLFTSQLVSTPVYQIVCGEVKGVLVSGSFTDVSKI